MCAFRFHTLLTDTSFFLSTACLPACPPTVGFVVAEWVPGSSPSYIAFQKSGIPLALPIFLMSFFEVFSVFTFQNPAGSQPWTISLDHEPGNLGFDPLGLKPTDAAEFKEMQTKELNNGRLAMVAVAGMIGQELVTGQKLF